MSLINRLIGVEMDEGAGESKLPIHECLSAWGEYGRGVLLWTDLISKFGLNTQEDTELQAWVVAVGQGAFTLEELEAVLMLGEGGFYSLAEVQARLGLS